MLVPEIRRQFAHAGVEQVGVLEHLVVEIILGGQAQRARLDAHVDVLGDQDHLALGVGFLQVLDHADDLVVGLAGGKPRRQLAVDRLGLQEQPAGRLLVAGVVERDALGDVLDGLGNDLVEEAARLARVARDLRHAFLVGVELLQRRHRDVDVVFLEAEQARGIVHQHVGVEHEQLVEGVERVTRVGAELCAGS